MPILRHEERIGTVLAGRFRVDGILGRGGMGVVFRGVAVTDGTPVAIKLLNYEYAERPEVVSRFIREANMLRALQHRNIVGVYDLGQADDGTVYLVLEYLEGQSLGDRLTELGVLGVVEAADVLLPVMDALAFAHESGVVHRDLKPDNIFVTHDADGKLVPKLLDFGIAKTLDKDSTALTQTGFVLGTPEYMSPEQAQGSGVGAAADIYSMGVVFYECLSGALPTGDLEGTAILVATATGRTTPLHERAPWLPKGVVECVSRALLLQPEARFRSMAEFASEMARACGIVRKSGEIRPPAEIAGRRKTQMGLRDPVAKASSPSLAQFHQANAYELGPMTTAMSAPAAPRAEPRASSRRGPLIAVAAVGLVAIGAGGAFAFAQRAGSGAAARTEPAEATDAGATSAAATPSSEASDGAIALAVTPDAAASADPSSERGVGTGRVRVRDANTRTNSAAVATGNSAETGATPSIATPTNAHGGEPTHPTGPTHPTSSGTRTNTGGTGAPSPTNPLANYEE